MKKFILIFTVFYSIILFLPALVCAQVAQTDEWIRVQSDNGEFSIEIPAQYTFIQDKAGFSVAESSNNYSLEEMKMLNAYQDKTLLSFESYKANKKALKAISNSDDEGKTSEIKGANFTIKQFVKRNADFYMVRQYFSSKNYIYVLTAASRDGETPAIKRFLTSLLFDPAVSAKSGNRIATSGIPFTALKVSQIEIDENPEAVKKPVTSQPAPAPKTENVLPVLLLTKPRAAYTDAARMSAEVGTIQLRLTFSKNASITKVGLLRTLKAGLTRQAFFSALRIKFIPSEKDGQPQTVTKLVEYSFQVY